MGYGIGIYAPAGFVTNPAALERAVARLSALGHRVVVDATCTTRWERFSATDDARLAAICRMADDPRVDLAIAARGGYGWSRLLDRIDFAALAGTGKRWLGHSDFTAFQLAALAHAGMTTFAGPMAAYDFGAATPSAFTIDHCWGLLGARPLRGGVRARRSRLRRRGHALGRQPGDGRASRRHAASAARGPRHPVPRGHRRAPLPDRADALSAPLRRAFWRGSARCCSVRSTDTSSARTTTATTRRRWSPIFRATRRAPIHRPAVRPRAGEAHAAGGRALRTDRARRPRAARLQRLRPTVAERRRPPVP